ncbi:unnamed protein product [Prunus armeniaca]|uniref:High chlorophyll fluorescence 153 n=1 Tax=Prunus armeniaca TaxID=36596 RepID=A0A6J5TYB1_PRUAR|nr:hypothetical protein GBA52_008920 [Prunus armeniaca]KAH0981748.1 hypothetical protein GBA52_008925 [Prunus armeniaca]CAB4268207.1 unnamed protein product [Prunus armeniaca]CAB4268252.1 unnamed protein product [Prunus armeniaca]
MARLLISNTASLTLSPPAPSSRALLNPPHVPISPATRFSCRQARGLTVVTRAGPTTNQYVFAFVMPLSLIAVTVFTSMRIADKLDEDFLEEIAINQAIRETDEDDEVDMPIDEKPALPRTRNRPKREV